MGAVRAAEKERIKGKELTPYLLNKIKRIKPVERV